MSKGRVEEFSLDGARSPDEEGSAGSGSSASAGADQRRRNRRRWWRAPGPWVAAAVVLVVAGAFASPQGEGLERRPPATQWAAAVDPGRGPGVWVLGDLPVVAGIDGLAAFDPGTGETAWTVPLDDPACTQTGDELTCVHGEGENARVATIDAGGEAAEQAFPDADVAVGAGDEVIVAGGAEGEQPWLGRFTRTGASAPEPVWRYESSFQGQRERRWDQATLSQDIVTVSAAAAARADRGIGRVPGLAADVDTGEPRPAVVQQPPTGIAVATTADITNEWGHQVLPLPGPDPAIPGYPEAVFTGRGMFDSYGGDLVQEYRARPLIVVGDDIIIAAPQPGSQVMTEEVSMRARRIDARTGQSQWHLDRDDILTCPCATTAGTTVLAEASPRRTGTEGFGPRHIFEPQALLGLETDSGRHRWTLPISTVPDALAVGEGRVFVLTGSTLTAYAAR